MQAFCADVFEASRTVSYVETLGSKADTLHRHAQRSDERAMKRAYERELRCILKRLGIRRVEIAIDTKKDAYFGKELFHTRRTKFERGTDSVWEFVQVSVVWPVRIPLMAVPYPQGADLSVLSIELLEFARSLPLTIDCVLFDRGFYSAHLVDYLESRREKRALPFLLFVPKNEAVKDYIRKTRGRIGTFAHQFHYKRKISSWKPTTSIVVCKEVGVNRHGKPYDMAFATNLKPSFALVRRYKRRWNIETGFRIMEEGKIKTKSNHPLTRLFYFLLRALLTLIWVVNNITKTHYTYKGYLRMVEHLLRRSLVLKPPPIQPFF